MKKTLLIALALIASFAICANAEVIFDFTNPSSFGVSTPANNDRTYPESFKSGDINVAINYNGATTSARLSFFNGTNGIDFRCSANGGKKRQTFTVSSISGNNITKIEFVASKTAYGANVGTLSSDKLTWTGSSKSVTFTTSGQIVITKMTVTTASAGPITVATPTISNEKGNVTLNCETAGATIKYHVGDAAVTAAECTEVYSAPFTVANGQTVSAYAEKTGDTASEVVSQQISWEVLPVGDVTTTPAADNETITVERGTVITFSAENADALAFEVLGQQKETVANPYEYTATEDVIVTVIPIQEGAEVADKKAMFSIEIKAAELCGAVEFNPASGSTVVAGSTITATAANAVKYVYTIGEAEAATAEAETLNLTAPATAGEYTVTVTPYNVDGVAGEAATATYTVEVPLEATFNFAQVGTTGKDKYGQTTVKNDTENPIRSEPTTVSEYIGDIEVVMTIEGRHRNYGGVLRLQKNSTGNTDGGYFTLSVPEDYMFTKVEFSGAAALTATPGTYTAGTTHTWTPATGVETSSIKFTKSGSSNVDIANFTVTIAPKPVPAPEFTTALTVGKAEYDYVAGTLTLPYSFAVVNSDAEPVFSMTITDAEGNVMDGVTLENIPADAPAAAPARAAADPVNYEGKVVATAPFLATEEAKNYTATLKVSVDGVESVAAPTEITTAVENIVVDANAPAEYFNLQGVRVANPTNGLYIRRQGSTVSKVYVR